MHQVFGHFSLGTVVLLLLAVPPAQWSQVRSQSDSPELCVRRAEESEKSGRPAEAARILEEGQQRFPRARLIEFQHGLLCLRQEEWSEAVAHLERSLASAPYDVPNLYYLAQAYYLGGRRDEAMRTIRLAAHLAPDHAEVAQKLGQYLCASISCDEGIKHLLRARALDPTLDRIEFEIGMGYYRLQQLVKAREFFELALKRDARDSQAEFFLAETWALESDWPNARSAYERALRLAPDSADGWYGLGRALIGLQRYEEALAPLQKSLEFDPGRVEAHFQLGRALRELDREQEAQREMDLFARAKERLAVSQQVVPVITPEQTRIWDELKALLDQGKEAEALDYLRGHFHYSKLAADKAELLLGGLYLSAGKPHDAVRVFSGLLSAKPGDLTARAWMGRSLALSGSATAAEREYREVLDWDPSNTLALAWLGDLRYAVGHWREAAHLFEQSRSRDPDILLHLIDAYLRLGDRGRAQETAAILRVLEPKNARLEAAVAALLDAGPR